MGRENFAITLTHVDVKTKAEAQVYVMVQAISWFEAGENGGTVVHLLTGSKMLIKESLGLFLQRANTGGVLNVIK